MKTGTGIYATAAIVRYHSKNFLWDGKQRFLTTKIENI
jgi:hypothetical protein